MKLFCLVWCIVMLGDLLLPVLLSRRFPRYTHLDMALSVLGCQESPVSRVYNLWCILSGLVFCAAAVVLFFAFRSKITAISCILLLLYGIGCEILSGLFPLPTTERTEDRSARIHGISSALGFTALLFVPLLFGFSLRSGGFFLLGALSFLSFFVAFACFCCFILGEKEPFRATVLRHGGLWQRLTLAACYVPLFLFSLSHVL